MEDLDPSPRPRPSTNQRCTTPVEQDPRPRPSKSANQRSITPAEQNKSKVDITMQQRTRERKLNIRRRATRHNKERSPSQDATLPKRLHNVGSRVTMDNVGTSAQSKYCVGLELCYRGKLRCFQCNLQRVFLFFSFLLFFFLLLKKVRCKVYGS